MPTSLLSKVSSSIILLFVVTISAPYLMVLLAIGSEVVTDSGIPAEIFDGRTVRLIWASIKLSSTVAFGSLLIALLMIGLLGIISNHVARVTVLVTAGLLFCLSPVIHLIGWRAVPMFAQIPPFFSTCGVLIWRAFPIMLSMLILGLATLDRPGIEMGTLHSGYREIIKKLVLPRLLPVVIVGGIAVFALTFMEGEVPPLIGIRVYPEEFMSRVALESTFGGAAVAALPFFIIAFSAVIILLAFWPKGIQLTWQQNGIAILDRHIKKIPYSWLLAIFIVTLLLTPIVLLLKIAGDTGFSDFFAKNTAAILTSFNLGFGSALLTLIVAYILADFILVAKKRYQIFILAILTAQLFLPGSLLGLGMIELTHFPGLGWLDSGNLLLIVTHSLHQIPYATLLLVWLNWLDINRSRDDLRLVGASWFNTFRYLRFPREWPRLLVILGLVFVLALAELSSTILVVAPGTETIILRLYNLMHYGNREAVAALAFVQALLIILILLSLITLTKLTRRDSN